MGQVQSSSLSAGTVHNQNQNQNSTPPPSSTTSPAAAAGVNNSQSPSFNSLISEAAAYGNKDENESLEVKAERALDCPCIAHLRTGSCGVQFSDAFLCFLKSTAEEKGSDCVHPFVALQSCIKANPNAFSEDVLEGNEAKEEEQKPSKGYRIIPPIWSVESKAPKPKL